MPAALIARDTGRGAGTNAQPAAQPVPVPQLGPIGVGAVLPTPTQSQPRVGTTQGRRTTGDARPQPIPAATPQATPDLAAREPVTAAVTQTQPQGQTQPQPQAQVQVQVQTQPGAGNTAPPAVQTAGKQVQRPSPQAQTPAQLQAQQAQAEAERLAHPPAGSRLDQTAWDALPNDAKLAILGRSQQDTGPTGTVDPNATGTVDPNAAQLADEQASRAAAQAKLEAARRQADQAFLDQRHGEQTAGGAAAAAPVTGAAQTQQQPAVDPNLFTLDPPAITTKDPFDVGGTIGTGGTRLQLGPGGLQLVPGQPGQQGSNLTQEQLQQLFGGQTDQTLQPAPSGQPGQVDPKLVPVLPADPNNQANSMAG